MRGLYDHLGAGRKYRLAAGFGVTLATVAMGFLAIDGARGGDAADSVLQRAAVRSKAPELSGLVRGFQRDQVPSDRIPGDPDADLEATGTRQPGEDPSLSRRVPFGSRAAYVWPANNRACYSFQNMGGCVPTALMRRIGVTISTTYTSSDKGVTVFAFVAPGVHDVRLQLVDGSEIVPNIEGDVLAVTLGADPLAATWTNPDGSEGRQENLVVRTTD